ncbi:MAG: chemotaxis protein CheA [Acidobacteriota bacterium]
MKDSGLDTSKYIDLYLSEAREHLSNMESSLVKFPGEGDAAPVIHELFRHAHSLKGMSVSMGFGAIVEMAELMEEIFNLIRNREMSLSTELIDLLMDSTEKIYSMLDSIEKTKKPPEPAITHVLHLNEVIQKREIKETRKTPSEKAPAKTFSGATYDIEIYFSKDAPLLSARAILAYKKLTEEGEVLQMVPELEELKKGSFEGKLLARVRTPLDRASLEKVIHSIAEVEQFKVAPVLTTLEATGEAADETVLPSSVRVKTEHLDRFLDDLVELMIQHERLSKLIEKTGLLVAQHELEKVDKTIKDLYAEVMKIRMLPFSYISRRFEKSVRELSKKLNKKIALKIFGSETELDRSILEEISDPINHLIRNCIDHGIEDPPTRKRLGKSETGSIIISLKRQSDSIIITIEDDGAGIDIEKVKRLALQENFITKEAYDSINDASSYMLITIPGFSTVKKVTAVSGRGVGLDAVRTKIENLGGKIKIGPRAGGGTSIEFTLPLTVVVINAFIARDGEYLFAIPVTKVEKTIEIVPSDVIYDSDKALVGKDGSIIHVFDLSFVFGKPTDEKPFSRRKHLLIFKSHEKTLGLAVDQIIQRKSIVVRSLGSPLDQLREYSGASVLEDGKIALILDIFNVVKA